MWVPGGSGTGRMARRHLQPGPRVDRTTAHHWYRDGSTSRVCVTHVGRVMLSRAVAALRRHVLPAVGAVALPVCFGRWFMLVHMFSVCVCVCVCERERERERECVCVCM